MNKKIFSVYETLLEHFGRQHWWPADTPLEMCLGAILTQNTNWTNVEKAIANLKENNLLTPLTLLQVTEKKLAKTIKPSGYFNVKAKRIKSFVSFIHEKYQGDLNSFFSSSDNIREILLDINGIGPETADSMLLYAGDIPVFVIDTYTKRIFSRLSLTPSKASYDEVQSFFMKNLNHDASMFNEFHALIVMLGKNYCKPTPTCTLCPLKRCIFRKNQ